MITQIFNTNVRDLLENIQDNHRHFNMTTLHDFSMRVVNGYVVYSFYVYCGSCPVYIAMSGVCYQDSENKETAVAELFKTATKELMELYV